MRQLVHLAVLVMTVLSALPASAADDADDQQPRANARDTAATGGFLPWTSSARKDTQQGVVNVSGGYDGARKSGAFEAGVEVNVWGPLSLRGGAQYSAQLDQLRPVLGGSVQALKQESHGVDMALSVNYRGQGFNMVPAVESTLALGRRFERTALLLNLGHNFGLEEGEHGSEVRVSALHRVGQRLHLGLDSRARFDLEKEFPEPAGEAAWDAVAGPIATYNLGRFAVSGYVGGAALKLVGPGESTKVGVAGGLGFGSVF